MAQVQVALAPCGVSASTPAKSKAKWLSALFLGGWRWHWGIAMGEVTRSEIPGSHSKVLFSFANGHGKGDKKDYWAVVF